jgi:hypothetical protein
MLRPMGANSAPEGKVEPGSVTNSGCYCLRPSQALWNSSPMATYAADASGSASSRDHTAPLAAAAAGAVAVLATVGWYTGRRWLP